MLNESELFFENWCKVQGSLKQLTTSSNTIWGIDNNNNIWFRDGINSDNPMGTEWISISGSLNQISASDIFLETRVVWGTDATSQVYFRARITENNPKGTEWEKVDGSLVFISVGKFDQVWGTNDQGDVYYRQDITEENLKGTKWEKVESGISIVRIAVGNNIVWGLSDYYNYSEGGNKIYFRTKITKQNPQGNDWQEIDGRLVYITARNNQLWGTNSLGNVWFRKEITDSNLGGIDWKKISNEGWLTTISNNIDCIWGTNKNGEIYYRKAITVAVVAEMIKTLQKTLQEENAKIKSFEDEVQRLVNLIKNKKDRVIRAYLYSFTENEQELLHKLITAHLEYNKAKKQKLPSVKLKREKEKFYDELMENIGEEQMEKVEKVLNDCEDLIHWDLELDEKIVKRNEVVEESGKIIQKIVNNINVDISGIIKVESGHLIIGNTFSDNANLSYVNKFLTITDKQVIRKEIVDEPKREFLLEYKVEQPTK